MKIKKLISAALAAIMCTLALSPCVLALSAPVPTLASETGRSSEEITLSDGTKTGVRYTQINLSGSAYGTNKVLRLAECDLSNTNLSIDVINCGTYTVSKSTVASASNNFSKNGKTVLAALNGDLWMTSVNSNTNVTKSILSTTRGIMMIDGEIWATQEFGMENYMNTSNAGTTATLKSAFGVTDKNQPLVGAPVFTVTVTNETKGKTLTADGLNRLPAWNSLVVYNRRINSANYALNDSYEIELEAASTAFTVDNKVTAKVKAIYPSGSTTRPAIGANTVILTARGSRMTELSSVYSVGDTVSFDFSLVDEYGRTELWQNVTDAIGGHMQVIRNDKQTFFDTSSNEYPTSLIGVKDDGTVMFANMTASSNGVYKGLRFKDAYNLCSSLGYNNVFYLDGGGSSSIVTLNGGTYTQRNYSSDGSPRAVINAVAMVWNDTPVCEKQGSLGYITTSDELSNISPSFIPAGILERIIASTNTLDCYYMTDEDLLHAEPSSPTIDPYIYLDLSGFSESIDASKYKLVTLKLKTNITVKTQFALYYFTNAQPDIQFVTAQVSPSSSDIWVTFNMASSAGWSGLLTGLRLDFFEGITSSPGQYVDIEYIAFSASPRDVSLLQSGIYPTGSIKNYYAYKDCNGNHSYTVFSKYNSESHTVECESCGYSALEAHTKDNGVLVPPTCADNGSLVYSCKDCKSVMSTTVITATGHTYSDNFTVDKEPTSTQKGSKSRHCLYCDSVTDVTEIPALGIKGDVNSDGTVNGKDANYLQKIVSGTALVVPDGADINGDGSIDARDMQLIKRVLAGV